MQNLHKLKFYILIYAMSQETFMLKKGKKQIYSLKSLDFMEKVNFYLFG